MLFRSHESWVALLEDDSLVELMFDRPDEIRLVGDIYLGRVDAVLPGIQAAFVDIGAEKAGFLHASDLTVDEDEELEPRQALNAVPYARLAGTATNCERRLRGRLRDSN